MTIELLLFRTGAVELARSHFAPWLPASARDELVIQPVWSALLRTAEGLILFDTGLHPVHIARPEATFGARSGLRVVMSQDDAILSRLRTLGVGPEDIAIVVNSHLHFDHAGNNRAFPKAAFIVQAEHLAYAKGRANFPAVYWDDPHLTYVPASGRAPVAPGVEVVPTPGHAPGHQSLVVDLPQHGRVVLCGDAAFTRANLERGETPGEDPAAARESLALIRSLVKQDLARAFTSHDADAWSTWRHAPAGYR
ncbi:MAG: N-acyl homoserine lactonase family protein [Chloroflexota bacterium]|nr:N-acyl homoserine lactonase family protein [Chloroflexota bacterium]